MLPLAFAVQVGKWAECDALIEAAYAQFGRVDVLVNNAGMSPPMLASPASFNTSGALLRVDGGQR